ncbi:MFS transporter, partial [Pseudomonas sp. CrR25]|nr:MFS transporter [Pseudomonas sp. CrR25]
QLGARALPLYFAAVLALLAAYTLYRLRHVSDLVSGEHAHFMPMLRTSHTVLELMPDAPPAEPDGSQEAFANELP